MSMTPTPPRASWARRRLTPARLRVWLASENGFALPLTIVLIILGLTLAIPFVSFAGERFKGMRESAEDEEAYFAADAGIQAVLADLRQGVDALSFSYTVPAVTLNGFTPSISVAASPRVDYVSFGSVFVDPESATSLGPLAGNTDFLYVADNVAPFADFQVAWVFTPPDNGWQLTVYEGVGTAGSNLANTTKNASPGRLTVNASKISGGTYTVRFRNKSSTAITSAAFSPFGEPDKTWLRLSAFKDYVITSTAGDVTLKVFARQGPGPNQVTSTVHVTTWHGPT